MKTETHQMTPYMKKFFDKLLDLKGFLREELERQKDPRMLQMLDKILKQLNDIIKVEKGDLQ